MHDFDESLTTEPNLCHDTVLSAGICDTCSVPKMLNTGDGINEPFDPILYCHKMTREICPELLEDRMVECQFYTVRCCANCQHFNYDAPRFDQPYPEFWCSKEHWCGISSSEEYEALHKPFDCVDFIEQK